MKDKAYFTGLLLIGLTFLICVISFWLIIFGIFVFGIGVWFVFVSKKPKPIKLLTTILPIALYIPTTYLFLLAYNYTTPKTFLIPDDYNGQIRIVYEEPCGMKMRKENGRQILPFSENGILILNEKFDGGINNDYYLIDKNGKRTRVQEILRLNDSTKKLPYILVGGAGTMCASNEKGNIKYSDFYLYNRNTMMADNDKTSQKFDSLTTAIVNFCRTK